MPWRSITITVLFVFSGLAAVFDARAESTGEIDALQQLAVVEAELQQMLNEPLKGLDKDAIQTKHAAFQATLQRFQELQVQSGQTLEKAKLEDFAEAHGEPIAVVPEARLVRPLISPFRVTFADQLMESFDITNPFISALRSAVEMPTYLSVIARLARLKTNPHPLIKRNWFAAIDGSAKTERMWDPEKIKFTIRRAAILDLERLQLIHMLDAAAEHFVYVATNASRFLSDEKFNPLRSRKNEYRGYLAEFAMFALAVESFDANDPERLILERALALATTEFYQMVWQVASRTSLGTSALLRAQEPYIVGLTSSECFQKHIAGGYQELALRPNGSKALGDRNLRAVLDRFVAVKKTLSPIAAFAKSSACKRELGGN